MLRGWPRCCAPDGPGLEFGTIRCEGQHMGDESLEIRELLAQGLATDEVAGRVGVPRNRVNAVKAHMTMGTYERTGAGGVPAIRDLEEAADAADLKFGLERDMQDALRREIQQLDPSLRIVDDGKERQVEAGFIDILAEDDEGALVVIELKSGEAPETAITQLLSYIGSLRAEDASRTVRGILVAREFSTRSKLAAQAADLQLVTYGYNFTFTVCT